MYSSSPIPGIFTMTLDMMMRFLVLLGRHSHAMLEAISLRTVGSVSGRQRDRARYKTAGGVLGTTFLVSQRLSQQTFEAMECRGYDGVYKEYNKHKAGWQDAAYALLIPLVLAAFWYCQSIML